MTSRLFLAVLLCGNAAAAPLTVATAPVRATTWTPELTAVGNLVARYGTDLSFQTSGLVTTLALQSGAEVAEGTVLAQLQLNDEPGLLAQYEAQVALDDIVFQRDTRQFQAQAVSRAVVDHDRLTLAADRGRAEAERGLIAMKTLRAPFAGRLGIRLVNPGQYLQPGMIVVTLQASDPIFADFYVPQNLASHLAAGLPVAVGVDAWPGRNFPGVVSAITPAVDLQSRTILVRARLDNHAHALLPGMFAHVHLHDGPPTMRLTLPSSSVVFATYGASVWLVSDRHVHQVEVATGPARGDQISIDSGLAAGQIVVSAGQTKLYEGAEIRVNNAIEPDAAPDPHVPEE